jgi:GT2 family glycosyltransferase
MTREQNPAADQDLVSREVTIAILNYNGREFLEESIRSIEQLNYTKKTIILVDDGSTDESLSFVKSRYPNIRVIALGYNSKLLNKVRNEAIRATTTDLILITDNDIVFRPDCLQVLVAALDNLPNAAVVIPRIMYAKDKDRIYIDRNRFHYVCASIDENREKRLNGIPSDRRANLTFGCGIMLIDTKKVKSRIVDFFDEDYPMGWGDDGEFHHRVNLSGLRCYAVPTAVVYHKAIKGAPRIYGQLLNRWQIILETYSWRTVLLVLPAMLLYECALFVAIMMTGRCGEYLKACKSLARSLPKIVTKRTKVHNYKIKKDREILTAGPIYAPAVFLKNPFVRLGWTTLNLILNSYWFIARRFV